MLHGNLRIRLGLPTTAKGYNGIISWTGLWSVHDNNNPKFRKALPEHSLLANMFDLQIQDNAASKLGHPPYMFQYASIQN